MARPLRSDQEIETQRGGSRPGPNGVKDNVIANGQFEHIQANFFGPVKKMKFGIRPAFNKKITVGAVFHGDEESKVMELNTLRYWYFCENAIRSGERLTWIFAIFRERTSSTRHDSGGMHEERHSAREASKPL